MYTLVVTCLAARAVGHANGKNRMAILILSTLAAMFLVVIVLLLLR